MKIEAMTEADWPAVKTIWQEGIDSGEMTFTAAPAKDWATFASGRLEVGRLVVRAKASGEVVGWCGLSRVSQREPYRGVAELGIVLTRAARGKGVGTALLKRLIAESETAGFWTLQAGIFPENAVSLALHARCGFRMVGRHERIAQMPPGSPRAGQWRDTVVMERRSEVVGV